MCIYMSTYLCTYIHTHAHTYIHKHTLRTYIPTYYIPTSYVQTNEQTIQLYIHLHTVSHPAFSRAFSGSSSRASRPKQHRAVWSTPDLTRTKIADTLPVAFSCPSKHWLVLLHANNMPQMCLHRLTPLFNRLWQIQLNSVTRLAASQR